MGFDLDLFIRESNLIDPQPNYDGSVVIPGAVPGDPMFDNMKRAWEVMEELAKEPEFKGSHILTIHRELTRDIDFFEYRDGSGKFRKYNVFIGGEICPPPYLLHTLIYDLFVPFANEQIAKAEDKYKAAYEIHDLFECIHPFIDGNGRTGRLLLNMMRIKMGVEPVVILYEERNTYYGYIRMFRDGKFQELWSEHFQSKAK